MTVTWQIDQFLQQHIEQISITSDPRSQLDGWRPTVKPRGLRRYGLHPQTA